MEHFAKFKVTHDGAILGIENDLEAYNTHILCYKLPVADESDQAPTQEQESNQSELDLNAGNFELLKAFVRLLSAEPKQLVSVINLVIELGNIGVRRGNMLLKRSMISQNSLEMVLLVERYLRNRPDFSKSKLEQLCKECLP